MIKNSFFVLFFTLILATPSLSYAEGSSEAGGGDMVSLVAQLVIIFSIFYFLLIRPQQKKLKQHQQMTIGLAKGNKVITSGGIVGVVTKAGAEDKIIEIEIASGVKVDVLRSTVSEMLEEKGKVKKSDSDEPAKKETKSKTKTKAKTKKAA